MRLSTTDLVVHTQSVPRSMPTCSAHVLLDLSCFGMTTLGAPLQTPFDSQSWKNPIELIIETTVPVMK